MVGRLIFKLVLTLLVIGCVNVSKAKNCNDSINQILDSDLLSSEEKYVQLKSISEACKDSEHYKYFLGVLAVENKKYLEAQNLFTHIITTRELKLREATYKQLVSLFLKSNDLEMAEETAKSYVQQFPKSAVSHANYSHVLLLAKDFENSILEGTKAYELSDDAILKFDMLKLMVISYHEIGQFNNSIISFQKAGDIDKRSILSSETAILFACKSLIKVGHTEEAYELLKFYMNNKNLKEVDKKIINLYQTLKANRENA